MTGGLSPGAQGTGRGLLLSGSEVLLAWGLTFPLSSLHASLLTFMALSPLPCMCMLLEHSLQPHGLGGGSTCPWPFIPLSSFTNSRVWWRREKTGAQRGRVRMHPRGLLMPTPGFFHDVLACGGDHATPCHAGALPSHWPFLPPLGNGCACLPMSKRLLRLSSLQSSQSTG